MHLSFENAKCSIGPLVQGMMHVGICDGFTYVCVHGCRFTSISDHESQMIYCTSCSLYGMALDIEVNLEKSELLVELYICFM